MLGISESASSSGARGTYFNTTSMSAVGDVTILGQGLNDGNDYDISFQNSTIDAGGKITLDAQNGGRINFSATNTLTAVGDQEYFANNIGLNINGTNTINGSGTFTFLPDTDSSSFTADINISPIIFGSSLTGFSIGDSQNTTDLTVGALDLQGPISLYGTDIEFSSTVVSSDLINAIGNLEITSSGSLTLNSNAAMTVNGNFTNNGVSPVTLHSDSDEFSSLLVSGTASGDITYNRYVNVVGDGEWDLIGAPVSGMAFSSLITDTNIATNGSFYAVGSYDNTTDTWTNATTETAGNLALGQGYQMATTSGGTLSFTGAIADGDQTVTITNSDAENAGAGRRWNLIANPFASYLNGNSIADGTNNFLTVNTAAIDDNFEAIYGWKADGTGYEIYNNSSTATHIAPGQGFFVAAAGSGENQTITLSKAMQTVTGSDDFVAARSSASYELVLDMYSDGVKEDDTKFYFKEGLTLGLDPGYDAGAFNQSSGFSSRLVDQDNGIGMGINAMPTDAMSNVIVPLTINQEAGIALKIQIANSTIPEGINVYLEDTVENTFTLLTNEGFELTAQTTLSGIGRFFIHYTTSTLSTDTVSSTSLLTAYKGKGNTYISVEGLQQFSEPANLILYNVLGMKVLSRKIQSPSQKETLSTLGMRTGVYILKVQAENIVFTKKLVIE